MEAASEAGGPVPMETEETHAADDSQSQATTPESQVEPDDDQEVGSISTAEEGDEADSENSDPESGTEDKESVDLEVAEHESSPEHSQGATNSTTLTHSPNKNSTADTIPGVAEVLQEVNKSYSELTQYIEQLDRDDGSNFLQG